MLVVPVVLQWRTRNIITGRLMQQEQPAWRSQHRRDLGSGFFHFKRRVSLNSGRRERVGYDMAFTRLVSRTLTTSEWKTFPCSPACPEWSVVTYMTELMCARLTAFAYITHAEFHMYKKHFVPMHTFSTSGADNFAPDGTGVLRHDAEMIHGWRTSQD